MLALRMFSEIIMSVHSTENISKPFYRFKGFHSTFSIFVIAEFDHKGACFAKLSERFWISFYLFSRKCREFELGVSLAIYQEKILSSSDLNQQCIELNLQRKWAEPVVGVNRRATKYCILVIASLRTIYFNCDMWQPPIRPSKVWQAKNWVLKWDQKSTTRLLTCRVFIKKRNIKRADNWRFWMKQTLGDFLWGWNCRSIVSSGFYFTSVWYRIAWRRTGER